MLLYADEDFPLPAVEDELKRKELHCLRIRNHKVTRQVGLVYQKSERPPKSGRVKA